MSKRKKSSSTADDLRQLALALPGAVETITWVEPHFRIHDKIFTGLGTRDGREVTSVKLEKPHAEARLLDPRFRSAPYVGRHGWVEFALEDVTVPPRPPDDLALEALRSIEAERLWQRGLVKEYHSALSDVLRTYIERRWAMPAMASTSGEILCPAVSALAAGAVAALKDVLTKADLVKFAKFIPPPEQNEKSLAESVAFVELTNRDSDESSAIVRARVIAAREVLRETQTIRSTRPLTVLDRHAQELLGRAAARLGLSARAVCRTASVAVTVAALRGNASAGAQDVAEALQYRPLLGSPP